MINVTRHKCHDMSSVDDIFQVLEFQSDRPEIKHVTPLAEHSICQVLSPLESRDWKHVIYAP